MQLRPPFRKHITTAVEWRISTRAFEDEPNQDVDTRVRTGFHGHQTLNEHHCFPQSGSLPAPTANMAVGRQCWHHPSSDSMRSFAEPLRFGRQDKALSKDPLYYRFKALRDFRNEPFRPSEPLGWESCPRRSRRPESFDSLFDERERFHEYYRGISQPHAACNDPNVNQGYFADPTRAQSGSSTNSGPTSNTRPSLTRNHTRLPVPTRATNSSEPSKSSCTVTLDSGTQTCVACSEDLPLEDFSESSLTRTCSHTNSACKECMKQWIEARLSNGTWNDIKCLECDEMMQYTDVQLHADSDVFQKYDTLAAMSWLSNEEHFVWCRNQGCGSGQLHVGAQNTPMFQCFSCRSQYCIVHEVPWHEGETCTDFNRRMNGVQPMDNEQLLGPTGSAHFDYEQRPGRQRNSMCRRSNDRQERKLYDKARRRRWMEENAQLPRNDNVARSLEDDLDYAWSHTTNSTDAWGRVGRGNFSGYMPAPSREWAPQVSAARAAMSPAPVRSPRDGQTFIRQFWDDRSRVYPDLPLNDQRGFPLPTTFPRAQGLARNMPVQATSDEIYARQLQRQLDNEDEEGLIAPRGTRLQRQQSTRDAVTARALHGEFQREEQDRQEREAYQRRKFEEQQGEQTVKENAKQCPKCRWFIQKNNGCDHVSFVLSSTRLAHEC